MNGKDPLFKGKEFIVKPFKFIQDTKVIDLIKNGAQLSVPSRLRWRKEEGFNLLNIRWANTIEVSNSDANFLKSYQNTNKTFTIDDFGVGREEELANLLYKDAIISDEIPLNLHPKGVSINPAKLPSI